MESLEDIIIDYLVIEEGNIETLKIPYSSKINAELKSALDGIPEKLIQKYIRGNEEFWHVFEKRGLDIGCRACTEYRYFSKEEKQKALKIEIEGKVPLWDGEINTITGFKNDVYGYDRQGYNIYGFNEAGFHKVTGTRYDEKGYDEKGYDENGYNRYGLDIHNFNRNGYNSLTLDFKDKKGKTKIEYDYGVKDITQLKRKGWKKDGTNIKTGEKYDEEGYDIYGYNAEGYNRDGYDRYGYDKLLFNRSGLHKITKEKIDRKGLTRQDYKQMQKEAERKKLEEEYKKQGEKHPDFILVSNFLESNTSKILFSKKNNISIEQLNEAIKNISTFYPEMATKIAEKSEQSSAIHLSVVDSINKKLLSGEITIQQYSREFYKGKKINDLLKYITDPNERKKFHMLVVTAIASGELTMMDYMRLFSEDRDYKSIINGVNSYIKIASKEASELQGKDKPINKANIEIKSLKKYAKPCQNKDFVGERRGFYDSDGKIETVTITEKHVEYAKKYLQLHNEYICYSTINSILSKMVKGEITFEDIDKEMVVTISMKAVVANAINKGTTKNEVTNADSLEGQNLESQTPEDRSIKRRN